MPSSEPPPVDEGRDALVSFSTIARPVLLRGCADLVPTLRVVLRGWQIDRLAPSSVADPDIVIERTPEGYRRTSRWLSRASTYSDPLDAVCDFLVDLIKAFIAEDPGLLCLHCAAAQFGDGLVLFPSSYKAGKSLLSASLAASGVRLFTDDVLPVVGKSGRGMAPGILPRLRLPVPEDAATGLAAFVARWAGPRSERFLYLDVGAETLAPLGETAPIRGVVLLDRDADNPPEMVPAGMDDVLQSTVLRNFADNFSGIETLDRLHRIIGGATCYRMSYSAAGQAVAMLGEAFGGAVEPDRTGRATADG